MKRMHLVAVTLLGAAFLAAMAALPITPRAVGLSDTVGALASGSWAVRLTALFPAP